MLLRTHTSSELDSIAEVIHRQYCSEFPVHFDRLVDKLGYTVESGLSLLHEFGVRGTHTYDPLRRHHTIYLCFTLSDSSSSDLLYEQTLGEEIAHILLFDCPPESIEDSFKLQRDFRHVQFEWEAQRLLRAIKMPAAEIARMLPTAYEKAVRETGFDSYDDFTYEINQIMADHFFVSNRDFQLRIRESSLKQQKKNWSLSYLGAQPTMFTTEETMRFKGTANQLRLWEDSDLN